MKTRRSSRYVEPRAKTCPAGCPKQKLQQRIPERPYRDIHAKPVPGGCLDCTRDEPKQASYRKPRPCIPGTKPIPPKPPGGAPEPCFNTETYLDTFDCQQQPWRSSSQRVPGHHEHSYQALFRPSVGQGKITCDNLGEFASCALKPEWTSSKVYIPCAHNYGKTMQWRSSVRYIGDKGSKEKAWRSSVHNSAHMDREKERPYRSQISCFGGAYTADTETTQGPFRPILRYIPEFYPNRREWRPSRAHVCTKKCYNGSRNREHLCNPVPAFETEQKLPPRDLRKTNPLFFKQHPIKSMLYDVAAQDDPPDYPPHANEEGQLMPQSGKKPNPRTMRSNPTYDDAPPTAVRGASTTSGNSITSTILSQSAILVSSFVIRRDRTRRRIFPSIHIDHFDSSCLCVCKKREEFRPTIRIIDGPQHHSVVERNVLAGPLAPGNEKKPRFRVIGQNLLAPQGSFNQQIISGRFHCFIPPEPLTEQRAQYTTCKPWLRQEIWNDANQAYKENRCADSVVQPALTAYLYEDRDAVVS